MNKDEKAFLNSRDGKNTQFNTSVPEPRRPEIISAGIFLMRKFFTQSKSGIVCDAIIAYAKSFGWTWTG